MRFIVLRCVEPSVLLESAGMKPTGQWTAEKKDHSENFVFDWASGRTENT